MFSKTVGFFLCRNNNAITTAIKRNLLNNSSIEISEEVKYALIKNKPLVALESTIITHGMPYPDNVKCALEVQDVIREQGAIPATVAIINGKVTVGLSDPEIDALGNTDISKPIKTSRRDFPYVLSNKLNGGTTVSGTLVVASKVKIPIFATGGIGGVHRGAQNTFDISADLNELGRSSVAVVSSGVKSILDIPKTLEYLETQGVFVATFGDNNEFPAFYSRTSGSLVPYSINSALEAAQIIKCNIEMDMQTGMLFAVPIPTEYALSKDSMDEVIDRALSEMDANIQGKDITPYLLSRVSNLTKGKSLESNKALIKNNAKVAAEIAVVFSNLSQDTTNPVQNCTGRTRDKLKGRPVVIGGSILDCSAKLDASEIKLDGRTYDATFVYSAGGVARNICESMYKLGFPSNFLSAIGKDEAGVRLKSFIPNDCSHLIKVTEDNNTATCVIMFDRNGDCKFLMGDMKIHQSISKQLVTDNEDIIRDSPMMILDANLPLETLQESLRIAENHNIPVFYEPTDISHALKAFKTTSWKAITWITPNLEEAKQIANFLKIPLEMKYKTKIEEAAYIAKQVLNFIEIVIITLGKNGIIIARRGGSADTDFTIRHTKSAPKYVRHYPTMEISNVKNVSGAGDTFASGFLVAAMSKAPEEVCVSVGFAAARLALQSESAVPDTIFNTEHRAWQKGAEYIDIKVE